MKWRWLRRPKWLLVLGILATLLVWLFWPVKVFEGHHTSYLAVSVGASRDFLGMVSPRYFADPWLADRHFDAQRKGTFEELEGIGDEALWASGRLVFRTGNVDWGIEPAEQLRGFKRGDPAWKFEIEAIARRTASDLAEGRVERSESSRTCRVILWARNRYPDWKADFDRWVEGLK